MYKMVIDIQKENDPSNQTYSVSAVSNDLLSLKNTTNFLVESLCKKHDIKESCIIELVVTKDGEYVDSDEWLSVISDNYKIKEVIY